MLAAAGKMKNMAEVEPKLQQPENHAPPPEYNSEM